MNKTDYEAIFNNKEFQKAFIDFLHQNLDVKIEYDDVWVGNVIVITLCGKFIRKVLLD